MPKPGTVEFSSDNAIELRLVNEEGESLEDVLPDGEFDPDKEYGVTLLFKSKPLELAAQMRKVADWLEKNKTGRIRADID